jgi:DNA-binding MarR family transcriptional regulator
MDEIALAAEKLRLVVRVLNRRAQTDTGEGSPTRSEQAVLAWLDERGPLTPSALATAERVRPQSMGQTLDALEQRNLVARAAHPDDRRQVLISVTGAGREALCRGRGLRQAWLIEAMSTLLSAEERQALFKAIDLLDRIVRS